MDTEIHSLCIALRKPGGTIPDPSIRGDVGTNIPNSSSMTRNTTEMRIKLVRVASRYYKNVQRTSTADLLS